MHLDNFDYHLPPERIAQNPLAERDCSRLLVVGKSLQNRLFRDLPDLLSADDLLVVNNTRVVRARLFGVKDSGGRVEILVERFEGSEMLCQVRASKPLKRGRIVSVADAGLRVVERVGDLYRLQAPGDVARLLEEHGALPLPPYIQRDADARDDSAYQTVYAAVDGAVAAPTAGLHFTEALLSQLRACGVRVQALTLHVGAGTFQPVRGNDIESHALHPEQYEVDAELSKEIDACRTRGGRVVAVGTTVVRALEAAALEAGTEATGRVIPACGETRLFIKPGFRFRVVDALITNFHLPRSTLLMLVCAFAGYRRTMSAYAHAVGDGYRFFSYGDAMFIPGRGHETDVLRV